MCISRQAIVHERAGRGDIDRIPMKVGGFSLIKNAVRYDYPILEAIRSVLPLVDEFVVAVGDSEDGTEEYLRQIDDPKLRLLPTVWNPDLKKGGAVLADETNKAFRALSLISPRFPIGVPTTRNKPVSMPQPTTKKPA